MAKYEINGLKYDLNVDTGTASVVEGSVPEMLELVIPDSIEVDGKKYTVTEIGSYALSHLPLISIKLPDSIINIQSGAFSCCKQITSIVIPDSVQSLGAYMLSNCESLEEIIIGSGVTSIDYNVFANLGDHLKAVYSRITTPAQCTIDLQEYKLSATLYVPEGKGIASGYKKKAFWKKFAKIETYDVNSKTTSDVATKHADEAMAAFKAENQKEAERKAQLEAKIYEPDYYVFEVNYDTEPNNPDSANGLLLRLRQNSTIYYAIGSYFNGSTAIKIADVDTVPWETECFSIKSGFDNTYLTMKKLGLVGIGYHQTYRLEESILMFCRTLDDIKEWEGHLYANWGLDKCLKNKTSMRVKCIFDGNVLWEKEDTMRNFIAISEHPIKYLKKLDDTWSSTKCSCEFTKTSSNSNKTLDKNKLKELEDDKFIYLSYIDEYENVISYTFIFHDAKIFMDSSNNGEIFIADMSDINVSNIYNYDDIQKWYRKLGNNIIRYIIDNNAQDADIFIEWHKKRFPLSIGLGVKDKDGNVLEYIAEDKFIIE